MYDDILFDSNPSLHREESESIAIHYPGNSLEIDTLNWVTKELGEYILLTWGVGKLALKFFNDCVANIYSKESFIYCFWIGPSFPNRPSYMYYSLRPEDVYSLDWTSGQSEQDCWGKWRQVMRIFMRDVGNIPEGWTDYLMKNLLSHVWGVSHTKWGVPVSDNDYFYTCFFSDGSAMIQPNISQKMNSRFSKWMLLSREWLSHQIYPIDNNVDNPLYIEDPTYFIRSHCANTEVFEVSHPPKWIISPYFWLSPSNLMQLCFTMGLWGYISMVGISVIMQFVFYKSYYFHMIKQMTPSRDSDVNAFILAELMSYAGSDPSKIFLLRLLLSRNGPRGWAFNRLEEVVGSGPDLAFQVYKSPYSRFIRMWILPIDQIKHPDMVFRSPRSIYNEWFAIFGLFAIGYYEDQTVVIMNASNEQK